MEFGNFKVEEKRDSNSSKREWTDEEVKELVANPKRVVTKSDPANTQELSPSSSAVVTDDAGSNYPLLRIEFPPDNKYIAGKIATKIVGVAVTDEGIKTFLEKGMIPIVVDGNIRSVIEDGEGAEELLMDMHEVGKNKEALKYVTYKDKVIETINSASEGKLKETLLEFAEIMDYKPEFCEPIISLESAFFTAMDEVDHYAMSLQKRQIALLSEIGETLKKIGLLLTKRIVVPEGMLSEEDVKEWMSNKING